MKTNKELVEYLNSLKIIQKSSWDEDIPEDIYTEYFEGSQTVESELDVDKHRWYETSTEVLKMNGGFIGVNSVTDTFSEQSEIGDMFHTIEFFEMEEIPSVTYKKLK